MSAMNDPEMVQKFLVPELVSQIQAHSGENVFVEMAEQLQALTAAVLRTGKGGSVALKIRVKAVRFPGTREFAAGQVDVACDVLSTLPKPPRKAELQGRFWLTEDGWLSPIPPDQGSFDASGAARS